MPLIAAGFVFTRHDRRRLTAALRRVREVRHYRRLQAVLLVVEGHSVGATANLLKGSRRSRHQGAGPLPSAPLPAGSGRRQTLGPAATGARAVGRTLSCPAPNRPDELRLRGRGVDGPAVSRPPAPMRRGRNAQRAPAARAVARRGLGLEAAPLRLQPEGTASCPEKRALIRRLKQRPARAVVLVVDETTLRFLPPLRAAWAPRGQQAEVPISGSNARAGAFRGAQCVQRPARAAAPGACAGGGLPGLFVSLAPRPLPQRPAALAAAR
jgi:hypothetical protein